jgi:hypothetical protein
MKKYQTASSKPKAIQHRYIVQICLTHYQNNLCITKSSRHHSGRGSQKRLFSQSSIGLNFTGQVILPTLCTAEFDALAA